MGNSAKVLDITDLNQLSSGCVLFYKWQIPRKGGYMYEFIRNSNELITLKSMSSNQKFVFSKEYILKNFKLVF